MFEEITLNENASRPENRTSNTTVRKWDSEWWTFFLCFSSRLDDDEVFHDIVVVVRCRMTVLKSIERREKKADIAMWNGRKINSRDESDLMIDTSKRDFITSKPNKIWKAADIIRFFALSCGIGSGFLWHLKMTRNIYAKKCEDIRIDSWEGK